MEGHARLFFLFYLIILLWSPIPYGSNREWAWGLMETMTFLLAMGFVVAVLFNKITFPVVVRKNILPIGIIAVWIMFLASHVFYFPKEMIEVYQPIFSAFKQATDSWNDIDKASLSISPADSLQEVIKFACYLTIFVFTIVFCHSLERIKKLLLILMIFTTVVSLITLLSFIVQQSYIAGFKRFDSISGPFINRNHFAAFINMGLGATFAIVLSLGFMERRGGARAGTGFFTRLADLRYHYFAYFSLLVVALIVSFSRGGWASFALALFLVITILALNKHSKYWFHGTYKFVFPPIVIGFLYLGYDLVFKRLVNVADQLPSRMHIWEVSERIFQDAPLMGAGPGSYQHIYSIYDQGKLDFFVDYAHNDYLQILVEQGMIGLGLFLALVVVSIVRLVITIKYTSNMQRAAFSAGILLAILAMLAHAFVDFNFFIPSNMLYFMVFLGLANAISTQFHFKPRRRPVVN